MVFFKRKKQTSIPGIKEDIDTGMKADIDPRDKRGHRSQG
jgi:hypothetical protein